MDYSILLVDVAKIVLAEDDKLRKLCSMARGIKDFLLNKTGKVVFF